MTHEATSEIHAWEPAGRGEVKCVLPRFVLSLADFTLTRYTDYPISLWGRSGFDGMHGWQRVQAEVGISS